MKLVMKAISVWVSNCSELSVSSKSSNQTPDSSIIHLMRANPVRVILSDVVATRCNEFPLRASSKKVLYPRLFWLNPEAMSEINLASGYFLLSNSSCLTSERFELEIRA